jgi:hypothetical protein
MIKPTNGRVVLFTPSSADVTLRQPFVDYGNRPMTAHVSHVWSDRCVNLDVIGPDGRHYSRSSVVLLQDDDPQPEAGYFAEWMAYQKGQAAKGDADVAELRQRLGEIESVAGDLLQRLACVEKLSVALTHAIGWAAHEASRPGPRDVVGAAETFAGFLRSAPRNTSQMQGVGLAVGRAAIVDDVNAADREGSGALNLASRGVLTGDLVRREAEAPNAQPRLDGDRRSA